MILVSGQDQGRHMDITVNDITEITGFSRSQIDQIFSREALKPLAIEMRGRTRIFSRRDAIRLCVIAEFRRYDVSWDQIRGFDENSGWTEFIFGLKEDDYPHEEHLKDVSGRLFLVVHKLAKGPDGITERIGGETVYKFNGEFVDFEGVCRWLASDAFDRAAIIINFSKILERVDKYLADNAGQA